MLKDKIAFYINKWDPIGLMKICPIDEYESEINCILKKFNEQKDEKLLGKIIYDIFRYYFGVAFEKTEAECNEIASLILKQ